MPRHINDHMPTGATVAISADHLEEMFGPIRDAAKRSLDAPLAAPVAAPAGLSPEQFAELKELLAPGHELASQMLVDYKAQRLAKLEPSPMKGKPEPKPVVNDEPEPATESFDS